MKYRIRCATLDVEMELGEAEPLNAVISGLLGSLAGSALSSKGFSPLDGLADADDASAADKLRAKVADLRAERERRAQEMQTELHDPPPDKPPSH